MVHLHYLAKTYGRRPSEYLGITNSWTAYQLDSAVLTAGLDHEAESLCGKSNERKPSRKPDRSGSYRRPNRQLSTRSLPKKASGYQSIKTAVGPNIRRIAIPENGVW